MTTTHSTLLAWSSTTFVFLKRGSYLFPFFVSKSRGKWIYWLRDMAFDVTKLDAEFRDEMLVWGKKNYHTLYFTNLFTGYGMSLDVKV